MGMHKIERQEFQLGHSTVKNGLLDYGDRVVWLKRIDTVYVSAVVGESRKLRCAKSSSLKSVGEKGSELQWNRVAVLITFQVNSLIAHVVFGL